MAGMGQRSLRSVAATSSGNRCEAASDIELRQADWPSLKGVLASSRVEMDITTATKAIRLNASAAPLAALQPSAYMRAEMNGHPRSQ